MKNLRKQRPAHGESRSLVVVLATAFLIDAAMYSVLTPLLPDLVAKFHLSKATAGVLFSAYMGGQVVGAVAAAEILRQLGRRRVTQCALVVLAVSVVGFATADGFAVALFFRTVSGLAGGAVWVAAMTWLLAAGSVSRRAELVGTVMSIAIFGTLVGPLIGNAAVAVGQTPVFLAVAIACIWCGWLLPADARGDAIEEPMLPRHLMRTRAHLGILVGSAWVMLVASFIYGAFFVLLPLDLSAHGTSDLGIGWIFAICSALSALMNRWVGKKIDRVGMPRPTVVSIFGGALLLLALAFAESEWLIVGIVVIAIGFVLAVGVTPISSAVSLDADRLGVPGPSRSMIMLLVFSGGEAVGSLVAPMVAQRTSDAVVYVALAVASIANLAVVWLGTRARRKVMHL